MRAFPLPRLSRQRLPAAGFACILIVETCLAGFGWWRWREAHAQRTAEENRRVAMSGMGRTMGAGDRSTEDALRAMERRRDATRADCGARPLPPVPGTRAEAYFELSEYVEVQRAAAAAAGVALREGERFGFASHTRQGPPLVHAPRVLRQRAAAADLLDALWAARPYRFEGLQREDPGEERSPRRTPRNEADFAAEPKPALGDLPDGCATEHLRISFVGHGRALRRWLNQLAELPGPVIVRNVSVEPWSPGSRGANEEAPADAARFTVTAAVVFSATPEEGTAAPETLPGPTS